MGVPHPATTSNCSPMASPVVRAGEEIGTLTKHRDTDDIHGTDAGSTIAIRGCR